MSQLPIRVSTLKSDIKLGFDVYVKLPHKVLLYAKGEDDIEDVRLKHLKSKKVRKLYINDKDESQYQDYIDRCLQEAMNDSSLSIDDKADLVVSAGESSAERIFEDPESKKSYDSAQNTASNLINVLSQSDDLLKGIFDNKLAQEDDTNDGRMHKHAVNTSSLCISFAEFLELPKDMVGFLGVAGLFHDVAYSQYSELEKLSFFKQTEMLEVAALTKYKEHPRIGADILRSKEFSHEVVVDLILSHEEKREGNGFPNKLHSLEVHQEVMSICAYYDRLVTCFNMSREEVFKDFTVNQIGNFDLNMIGKFKEFVKKAGL